ncbi:MAG TPA: beta-propeller fold lactonase family protein, partial [Polyangiaceae bacterium]|nr:beta-propeller fold lactonase family protein [Polyangiaceae bacterium]
RFAYAAASQEPAAVGRIDRYQVAPNGALTPLGDPTPTPRPFGIAIDAFGRAVYATNIINGPGNGTLSAFRVGAGGTLTPLNTVDSGAVHPKGVAVTPDRRFVYVAHGTPHATERSALTGFALGADGSVQDMVARETIGVSGHRALITPDGRFVYVTHQESEDAPDIYGFRIGLHGDLTPLPGSPFEAGIWTEGAVISPDGLRLYVAALGTVGPPEAPVRDGQIRGFAIGEDGRLTEITRLDFGLDPIDMAFGLDGKHMYLSDFAANDITVFDVDRHGQLTPVQTEPSQGPNPGFQSVVVQPRLYLAPENQHTSLFFRTVNSN